MENELIIYIIGGILGALALGVFAYQGKKMAEIAALFGPIAESVIGKLDARLVPLGEQLAPLHVATIAASSLIDEPTDALVQALPANVIAAMRAIVAKAEALTDGKPNETVK